MPKKTWLNSVLILIALGVWGWNARLLTVAPEVESGPTLQLPELPEHLSYLFTADELPEMGFDPFNPFGEIKEQDLPQRNTRKTVDEAPPSGDVILIVEQGDEFEATFREPNRKTFHLRTGKRLGNWKVESIEFDRVVLKHIRTGQLHEMVLP